MRLFRLAPAVLAGMLPFSTLDTQATLNLSYANLLFIPGSK